MLRNLDGIMILYFVEHILCRADLLYDFSDLAAERNNKYGLSNLISIFP